MIDARVWWSWRAPALAIALLAGCGGSVPGGAGAGPMAAEAAARGEAAFYDTLFGRADRSDESVALLQDATAKNGRDGRSYFLLGMMHLFRFSQNVTDRHNVSAPLKQEIDAAQAALDAAVPLLPADRRVPGFRAAATYTAGVINDDPQRSARGLSQLREAIALYPEFNNFDFIGAVAPVVPPDDPLFQEVLQYVGDPLSGACTPFDQPQICGNLGKAPHNVEGALVLFGDLFAKAGDRIRAAFYYRLSMTAYPTTGGPWRFAELAEERLQSVAQRVALYKDDDPTNDPPLLGSGREACAVCHFE